VALEEFVAFVVVGRSALRERLNVGELKCLPPPAGTTKPFVAVMLVSLAAAE
jgi:hypothetical protein